MNKFKQPEGIRKAKDLGSLSFDPRCSEAVRRGQAEAQSYLPEAAIHILVTPAVLEASVSHGILGVGKSLKYIS